jgi:hypothetical protein
MIRTHIARDLQDSSRHDYALRRMFLRNKISIDRHTTNGSRTF